MTIDRSALVATVVVAAFATLSLGCATPGAGSGEGGQAAAAGAAPETSHDELALVKKTRSTALYLRPGVSFAQYDRLAILECPVAFRKNWERDQNEDRVDLQERVTARDMERIKSELSKEPCASSRASSRRRAATRSWTPAARTCSSSVPRS